MMLLIPSEPLWIHRWLLGCLACLAVSPALAPNAVAADDNPYAIAWAWSQAEVDSAGEGFWPQFRGPTADGHAAPHCDPPVLWSETENVRWKRAISGKAWSSPVIWGDTIWLTNATEDGLSMSVIAIDRNSGEVRFDKTIFTNEKVQPDFHAFNSYASPTPVIDGTRVYVSFGAYGTAALDRDNGELLWERRDLKCNHYRGAGSSPILFRNLLIFHMDGFDQQYAIALNKETGDTVWKSVREVDYGTDDGDTKKAFGTPLVLETPSHRIDMISPTSKAVLGMDPTTGKELWRVRYAEFSSASRPVFDGHSIFINTGFGKSKMIAVRADGQGDISQSHVSWEVSRAIGSKPSPLLFGTMVCSVDDRGVLSAFHRDTGDVAWQQRLGGDFSSSPILAKNRIYCFDEGGKGHVYSTDGKQLGVNVLEAGCLASPAVVGNDLIVRTRTHLYCIALPASETSAKGR